MLKIVLTAHSYLPKCRGVIGDTLEVPEDVAELIIARGGARLWTPPKEKPKADKERLSILEAKLASLEAKVNDGKHDEHG